MAVRDLIVRILGDDKDFQKALTRSERATRQFHGTVSRGDAAGAALTGSLTRSLGIATAGIVSAAAIRKGLVSSIQSASDLNEEIEKSRQVFGESAREIESWSKTTARSLGIARVEALRGAGSIGNMLVAMGLAPDRAAEMSKTMVQLAGDMASFNNEDPTAMLERLRSGLAGEMEPLRRFGSVLSAARVQTFAWANGIADSGEKLTEQQKILARYGLVLQDTVVQQGDAARTIDQLAGQTRVLRANFADLSATLGGQFIPAVTDAIQGVNLLFGGMDKLSQEFREFRGLGDPFGGKSLLEFLGIDVSTNQSLVGIIRDLTGGGEDAPTQPGAAGPGLGIGRAIAERAEQQAREMQREALEASRAQRRQQAAFDALTKGLGLKLDKARITRDLSDDLDVLREIERAIQRRIDREGKTFELVERLTAVRAELASVQQQRASEQAANAREAWENTLDAINLRIDIAGRTRSLQDDIVALRQLEQAVLRRISAEGKTTDLLRQLFDARERQRQVQEQMADRERQRAQEAARRRQGDQFEALGLTPEGQPRVPGTASLQRRTQNLREQIKGTTLDTEKTGAQLDRIAAVLRGKFGKVGRDVRRAILDMLNQISRALDQDSRATTGPLTKFAKRGVEDLIAGLGLTEEQAKELRQRMAQLGPGGSAPSRGIGAFGFRVPDTRTTQPQPDAFERAVEWHIYIDGEEVESRVTKRQQRKRGRSAPSRRGVRPGV